MLRQLSASPIHGRSQNKNRPGTRYLIWIYMAQTQREVTTACLKVRSLHAGSPKRRSHDGKVTWTSRGAGLSSRMEEDWRRFGSSGLVPANAESTPGRARMPLFDDTDCTVQRGCRYFDHRNGVPVRTHRRPLDTWRPCEK